MSVHTLTYGQGAEGPATELTVFKTRALMEVQTGKIISDSVVCIRDGEAENIVTKLEVPRGARLINPSGLIDANTHLCHEYYDELERTFSANAIAEIMKLTEGERVLPGVQAP